MDHEAEDKKPHPTRFVPGVSGNPNGAPKKGRNRTLDEIVDGVIADLKDEVVNLKKSFEKEKLGVEKRISCYERILRIHGVTLKAPDDLSLINNGNVQAIQTVIFGRKPQNDTEEAEYE